MLIRRKKGLRNKFIYRYINVARNRDKNNNNKYRNKNKEKKKKGVVWEAAEGLKRPEGHLSINAGVKWAGACAVLPRKAALLLTRCRRKRPCSSAQAPTLRVIVATAADCKMSVVMLYIFQFVFFFLFAFSFSAQEIYRHDPIIIRTCWTAPSVTFDILRCMLYVILAILPFPLLSAIFRA